MLVPKTHGLTITGTHSPTLFSLSSARPPFGYLQRDIGCISANPEPLPHVSLRRRPRASPYLCLPPRPHLSLRLRLVKRRTRSARTAPVSSCSVPCPSCSGLPFKHCLTSLTSPPPSLVPCPSCCVSISRLLSHRLPGFYYQDSAIRSSLPCGSQSPRSRLKRRRRLERGRRG